MVENNVNKKIQAQWAPSLYKYGRIWHEIKTWTQIKQVYFCMTDIDDT